MIIFEITIMEKVLPNQFKIHIFATVKSKMLLRFWCNQMLLSVTSSYNQTTKTFVKMSSLTKILIDWEGLFHDINHKNNSVIGILRFSTLCG